MNENKENKENSGFDFSKISNCSICKTWILFCMSDPNEIWADASRSKDILNLKEEFWTKNKNHLIEHGFSEYKLSSEKNKTIDAEIEKHNDLEGCLLVVKVGTKDRTVGQKEIEDAYAKISNALEGIKNVRV